MIFQKQYLLYTNSLGGMKGSVHEMMKITVLDYLYKILYPQTRPNPLYPDWSQYGEVLWNLTEDGTYIGSFLPDNPSNPNNATVEGYSVGNLHSFLFPTEGLFGINVDMTGAEYDTGVSGVKSSLTTVIDSLNIANTWIYNTDQEGFESVQGGVFSTKYSTSLQTRKLKNELQNLLGPPMSAAEEDNFDILGIWSGNTFDMVAGGIFIGDIWPDYNETEWGDGIQEGNLSEGAAFIEG